jgi:murein DD-endopeptidase MepM/ murein hydrolase activator NlpD
MDFLEAATNIDQKGAMGGGDITIDNTALVPDSGPSGTIADIQANDYQGAISIYVVRSGDTLPQIAKMFQVSLSTILSANKLSSGATVHEGDTLVILPVDGILHTVRKGDTLQGVAKKYGARVSDILDFNDLVAGQVLVAGDNIMVPNGKEGATAPTGSVSAPSARARLVASFPTVSGYFMNPLPTGHKTQGIHGYNGVDLAAPKGSPVYAAADGVVVTSHFRPLDDPWFGGYGNYIDINHPNGTQTRYAHLSAVYVAVGASVSQGQPIGEVGSTGHSTGPHLHFEVHGAKNPGGDWSWAK